MFQRVVAFYGEERSSGCSTIRPPPSAVAAGTVALTVMLLPGGTEGFFFPVQDTGVIQGISEGARRDLLRGGMAERQQALAKIVLRDPAVESMSSFIGVDGTNTTAETAAACSST